MGRKNNKRFGNPERSSTFICLECRKENMPGIQRNLSKEWGHVKTMYCPWCNEVTKNVEVRFMDNYEEVRRDIPRLREILSIQ